MKLLVMSVFPWFFIVLVKDILVPFIPRVGPDNPVTVKSLKEEPVTLI